VDQETWQYINAASSWLSAIATLAAVVVALHLARKDNRIELEVRAGIRKVGHLPGGKDVLFPVGVDIDDSFFPKPTHTRHNRNLIFR
jgi:hypothetical protein